MTDFNFISFSSSLSLTNKQSETLAYIIFTFHIEIRFKNYYLNTKDGVKQMICKKKKKKIKN